VSPARGSTTFGRISGSGGSSDRGFSIAATVSSRSGGAGSSPLAFSASTPPARAAARRIAIARRITAVCR
jgi:hypothetical protein